MRFQSCTSLESRANCVLCCNPHRSLGSQAKYKLMLNLTYVEIFRCVLSANKFKY